MNLPRLTEYYLIEAYDPDKTWENYGDAIIKRAHEGRHHVHLAAYDHREPDKGHFNTSVPANGPWEKDTEAQESARRTMISNAKGHFQYQADTPFNRADAKRQLDNATNGPIAHDYTAHSDNHLIAKGLRNMDGADDEYRIHAKRDFMEEIAKAAPHPKYIPTIAKMYANGSIKKIEDIGTQAKEAFEAYHNLSTHGRLNADNHVVVTNNGMGIVKKSASTPEDWKAGKWKGAMPGDKPIPETNFKAFTELNDVRAVTKNPEHREFFAKQRKDGGMPGNYTVVHDDDDVTVYHPHDHETSVKLAYCPHTGNKASWCTAADSANGKFHFDSYSKDGPLLIYHPKNPEHDGEMYQSHHASQQYMDENDDDVEYHHHSTRDGTNDIGFRHPDSISHPLSNEEERKPKARFPGFNSKSALDYTYKHMYEHPELYNRNADDKYTSENTGISHVERGTVIGHTFTNYFSRRNPQNQGSEHWRPVTSDEAQASRAEAEAKGKAYFPATHTVKDKPAMEAAIAHHHKVMQHYSFGGTHDDEHEDDDE